MLKKIVYLLTVAVLLFAGGASAEENNYAFGYSVVKDASGTVKLKLTTHIEASGMWLGVTQYPPQVKDAAKESVSTVYPIKQGRGITEIIVEPKFKNGTFEAAVWTRKLSQKECHSTDEFCKKHGYSMTGKVSYVWGHLVAP